MWPTASHLLRSLNAMEPTRIDRPSMSSYSWSTVTMGVSRTVFEIVIFAKFSHPPCFNAPLRGFPWNFVTSLRLKKSWMMSPLVHQKCEYTFIRLETIPVLDRRTDWQTDGFAVTISRSACITYWREIKSTTLMLNVDKSWNTNFEPWA